MHRVICAALFLSLLGCAVGPDYRRPRVEVPQAWRIEEKEAGEMANTAWWEQFKDPVLNGLIRAALQENKDLKIASARVEEFLGIYAVTRSALLPQVFADASVERNRVTERGAAPLSPLVANPATLHQAGLAGSWEIDLWGRLRRAAEAARADLLSREEGRRAVILTLVAAVAGSYVNLRDLDRQLEIARHTARTRKESYRIFQLRFQGGVISELQLNQVKSEYEQALLTIPVLEKSIARQENALSVLLGRNPGPIPRGKAVDELALPAVPAGLPSDLLVRRPDIRQAEQDLVAANARIGVARSLYFPSISLTGFFGWASSDLSHLFTWPARTWTYAVPLTVPVFTAGAVSGQVKAAEAIREQSLRQYQKVIQTAFREVEDALIDQRRTREQLAVQQRQANTLRDYARLARLRYENGYTSYIEVLDAERSLFNAQLALTQIRGALFQSMVTLYQAMGGGWVAEADNISAGG